MRILKTTLPITLSLVFTSTAFADWGINLLGRQVIQRNYFDYVSVDRSQHIYVDTKPLTEAVKDVAKAIEENSTSRKLEAADIKQLDEFYDLPHYGKMIGVDVGGAEAAAMVKTYGIAVYKKIIEDRLVNLDLNSALSQNFVRGIADLEPVSKLPQTSDRHTYLQADQLNAVTDSRELMNALDGMRRGIDPDNEPSSKNTEESAFAGLDKEASDQLLDFMKYTYRAAEDKKMAFKDAKKDGYDDKRQKFYKRMDVFHGLVKDAVNNPEKSSVVQELQKSVAACAKEEADQKASIVQWKTALKKASELKSKVPDETFKRLWGWEPSNWMNRMIDMVWQDDQPSRKTHEMWHFEVTRDSVKNFADQWDVYTKLAGRIDAARKELKTPIDEAKARLTAATTLEQKNIELAGKKAKQEALDKFEKKEKTTQEIASQFLSLNYGYKVAEQAYKRKLDPLATAENASQLCHQGPEKGEVDPFPASAPGLSLQFDEKICVAAVGQYLISQKNHEATAHPYLAGMETNVPTDVKCSFARRAESGLKVAQEHRKDFANKMLAVREDVAPEEKTAH
jgi:hypothetical protein